MFRAQEIAPELGSSASSSFKAEESPAPEELQVMAFTAKSMVFQWKLFTFMVDFHGFSISNCTKAVITLNDYGSCI